jgi:tetratricopeptide (TPR) repeat protein
VPDQSRIEDLRRRVLKDPASIAFAQLAEEHRRAGQYEEAVDVASAGLAHHPAYLSARVTLGRALLELGRLDEAAAEFEYVVRSAPDNLTAVRQLADIHHRRRQASNESRSRQSDVVAPPLIADAPPAPVTAEPAAVAPIGAAAEAAVPSTEELVIAELEAWLAVIDDERSRGAASHAHRR